jgi:hypothetical protein
MSEAIAEILAKCLERMEAGASLESCLADFPTQAAELEPLLRMTQQMKHLTNVGPRRTFARSARLNLENQLLTSGKVITFKRLNRHTRQQPKLLPQSRFSMSIAQIFIAAVLALAATTGAAAYAANASNPGDVLHGLDLAMENVQLNLARDLSSQVQLRLEFASERLAEAQATFSENDASDGLEALNEYGAQISAIAQLIGSSEGADQEALTSLLETAQGVHQDVLTSLLDEVPEQAQESIQNAIDASHVPADNPAVPPSHPGTQDGVGAPDGVGTPSGAGAPEGVGAPDEVGPPTDVPAGPPADIPGGPPDNTPGGQPSGTPGGRPEDPPGKP